ncbi:substrate-binding domain-containing protein (plasmid) [Mesorhizobium sp. ORM8.1]
MKKLISKAIAFCGAVGLCIALSGPSFADDAKKVVIGITMPYLVNTWQVAIVKSANWAVDQLNAKGANIELKVVDAGSDPQKQIQQVNNMIVEKVDFLLINSTSDTAINGAIDRALDAGIPTIVFASGPVTDKRPYQLHFDYAEMQKITVDYIAKRINNKGQVLNIRGLAGMGADTALQDDLMAALKAYPDIKIAAEMHGDWNQSTTQSRLTSLLPSLPKFDAVFTQGEMAYGAAQAFQAAGIDLPLIVMGVSGFDLNLLRKLNKQSGYDTIAITTDAGIGSVAINMAWAMLHGKTPPNKISYGPLIQISAETLNKDFPNIKDNESAYYNFDYDWTLKNIFKE